MSKRVLFFAALLLLPLFLAASAPARLLHLLLPEQVVAQGLRGSLWAGSADRVLLRLAPGYMHLGKLQWQLHPSSLLLLAPSLDFNSTWGWQRASGRIVLRGERSFDLVNFEAVAAADLLRYFLPLVVQGRISAQLEQLNLRSGIPVAARGRLVWSNGAWRPAGAVLPLGSYAVELNDVEGGAISGRVLTLSGPIQAQGDVALQQGNYSVDVRISGSQSGLAPPIREALSLLARPEGDDFRLQLKGEI